MCDMKTLEGPAVKQQHFLPQVQRCWAGQNRVTGNKIRQNKSMNLHFHLCWIHKTSELCNVSHVFTSAHASLSLLRVGEMRFKHHEIKTLPNLKSFESVLWIWFTFKGGPTLNIQVLHYQHKASPIWLLAAKLHCGSSLSKKLVSGTLCIAQCICIKEMQQKINWKSRYCFK